LVVSGGGHWSLFLIVPVFGFLVWELIRFTRMPYSELRQFVESAEYHDFSRHFDAGHGSQSQRELRAGFNRLNRAFQRISKEKETQYRYLEQMLSLIDTGILAYETESGTVSWMNASWKQMLLLPHLKQLHGLEKRNAKLYREIIDLQAGESRIVRLQIEQDTFKVMLTATVFITEGKSYKLIACKNISDALDATESKAWQQLLSVMTHEIMNSIAPISSLADTLKRQLQQSTIALHEKNSGIEDLELGISTIQKRSEGLLKFAHTYSQLNKLTQLQLQKVYAFEVLESICQLMAPTLEQKQIDWQLILKDPELKLEADVNLLEQVLINLLVNAVEAVKEQTDARIVLSAFRSAQGRTIIKVADNGPGIPEELWEKIFIPFFSSRKNGSGIGLSLCKQIMLLHKGNIQVQSEMGEGTAFLLYF
jgi:nitrogen fixation/metabolism regulation signal transduction histidine kinase